MARVLIIFLWELIVFVQMILSYGTAYRLTKNGGDNGFSLFGWMLVLNFASIVPGLGIYLWQRYRYSDGEEGDESR